MTTTKKKSAENTGGTGEGRLNAVISNDFNMQMMIVEAVCHAGSLMSVVSWLKAKSGGKKALIISNRAVRIN